MTTPKAKKRAATKTTWKKGQSANPGGRSPRVGPNGESLAELARAHTADCVKVLHELMMAVQNEPKDRIVAAVALLDRGWGKPKESVEVDAKVEGSGLPVIQIIRYDDSPSTAH